MEGEKEPVPEALTDKSAEAAYMSKRAIIELAQKRERMIVDRFQHIVGCYERELQKVQANLNGMTQLLGCIVERHGEQDFDLDDIEAMDPGRMYIIEEDRTWQLRIRSDASQPVQLFRGSPNIPDEALDHEKMAADGVTEVKVYDA